MFGGKYDPAALRFPDTFLASAKFSPLYGRPVSDARDWEDVQAWALSLAAALQ